VGEYGWRELAASLADEHMDAGSAAFFLFSGAPLWMYGGRARVEADEDTVTMFEGKVLKRKDVRQFLWEQKMRKDSPEAMPRTMVLWSIYDGDHDRSFLGLGRAVRVPKEVT